jgi:hypothetical protein
MVLRTEWDFSDLDDNVYYQMVKIISKYRNNPYLPRVRIFSQETNDKGQYKFTYELERLRAPLEMQNHLDQKVIDRIGQHMFYYWDILSQPYSDLRPWEQLCAVIDHTINENMDKVIQDPLLTQAIDILSEIKERHARATWDINTKNVMIRLTSTGPQPVFTDILHY